jgi:serine/threonine protein kinase
VLQEISFLRELQLCNNIVQIKEVYLSRDSKGVTSISLVMKYAEHGSLARFLEGQGLPEDDIRTVMAQLLLALDLMHRN